MHIDDLFKEQERERWEKFKRIAKNVAPIIVIISFIIGTVIGIIITN